MGMLILIACCGKKRDGGTNEYCLTNNIVNRLDTEFAERLMSLRRELCREFKLVEGPDLGFEEIENEIRYMPAYQRYNGNLYSKISHHSWNILNENPNLTLIIVSALYGLLNHNEQIRYYNLIL